MAYPIEKKFVIAIASSALFDLEESNKVHKKYGLKKYKEYQEQNIDVTLGKGVAFPFIKRLLSINKAFPEQHPVEVVLLSRNCPETGLRVFRSIQHYGLDISRAGFLSGKPPYKYLGAFNACLFLSAEEQDVKDACNAGFAAGHVLKSHVLDDDNAELRLAFDFDGVLANDDSEKIYKSEGQEAFHKHETEYAKEPLAPGLLKDLLQKVAYFQKLEMKQTKKDPDYKRILKTYIVTARNAPSHERVVNTLKSWDIEVDEAFFLGGIEKARFLDIMRPHMFFDDHINHLTNLVNVPAVHIPFGIANK